MNDEALKAISARIRVAALLLSYGYIEDAMILLKSLERVLPIPDQRNIDATISGLKAGAK